MEKCACQWNWLGEILVLPQSIRSFAFGCRETGFNHWVQWGHTPYKEFKNLLRKHFENSLFWIMNELSKWISIKKVLPKKPLYFHFKWTTIMGITEKYIKIVLAKDQQQMPSCWQGILLLWKKKKENQTKPAMWASKIMKSCIYQYHSMVGVL